MLMVSLRGNRNSKTGDLKAKLKTCNQKPKAVRNYGRQDRSKGEGRGGKVTAVGKGCVKGEEREVHAASLFKARKKAGET